MDHYDAAILALANTTQEELDARFYNCYPQADVYFEPEHMWTVYNGPFSYTELGRAFYHKLQRRFKQRYGAEPQHIRLKVIICPGQPVLAGLALKGASSMPPEYFFGLLTTRFFNLAFVQAVVSQPLEQS